MALVSRVATLYVHNTVNTANKAGWQATAAAQDTAAGGSVSITVTGTNVAGIANPSSLSLKVRATDGTVIRTYNLTPDFSTQTVTFFFTSDGQSGSSARADTVELYMEAIQTSVPAYDFDTDGTHTTFPSLTSADQIDRGWIRATATFTVSASNVSAGGAVPASFAYPDSIFMRGAGVSTYVSYQLTARVKQSGGATLLTATVGAFFGPNWDSAAMGPVNAQQIGGSFPAAVFTFDAPANATIGGTSTGVPRVGITYVNQTTNIDSRLTFTGLLQLNDNAFGTPPSAKDAGTKRLASDLGFVAARITNARGEGQNLTGAAGRGVSYSLDDNAALVSATTVTDQTTANRGGQDGWGPLMVWSASLPGGNWTNTITFKDSAGTQGTGTVTYILLASDPRISVVTASGTTDNVADHFSPGMTFVAGFSVLRNDTGVQLTPDTGTAKVLLARLNTGTGKAEWLDSDGVTWKDWLANPSPFFHTAVAATNVFGASADPNVFVKVFTPAQTSGWGYYDVIVLSSVQINGTPYGRFAVDPVVGSHNRHSSPLSGLGIPN